MSRSINYQPFPDSEMLDEFFLITGRAFYLAASFDRLCKYFHRHKCIESELSNIENVETIWDFIEKFKGPQLHNALEQLQKLFGIKQSDFDLLVRAKGARNYIAHELADIGPLNTIDVKGFENKAKLFKLKLELPHLIMGYILIIRCVYHIDTEEYESHYVQNYFSKWLENWVLSPRST